MNKEHLVQMINRIATFFGAQGGSEAAVAGVLGYLQKACGPRMRRGIVDYAEQGGGGLRPSALEAVRWMATQGLHSGLY